MLFTEMDIEKVLKFGFEGAYGLVSCHKCMISRLLAG